MLGKLYIVATPIGNLEDITLRALKVLKSVDIILAEDTRRTKILLEHYDIVKDTLSYHHHSPPSKKDHVMSFLLEGKNLGLVTDAGTPGISDPGNELISHILEREPDIKVIPIPGASALVTALSVSGFNVNRFVFLGFLPKKKRKKLLKWVKESNLSFAFYESPNRLFKTLLVLSEHFGPQKRILVARELTKLHETLYRGAINQIKGELDGVKIRGEIVVVVEA